MRLLNEGSIEPQLKNTHKTKIMTTSFDPTENIISAVDFMLVDRFDLDDPEIDDQFEMYLNDLAELPNAELENELENELERVVIEEIAG